MSNETKATVYRDNVPTAPDSAYEALLTEQNAAAFLSLSVRTLQSWRLRGGGPRFVKCGSAVRYRRRDLDAWIEQRTVAHTSEAQDRLR